MTIGEAIKSELKVDIPVECLKKNLSNDNISYTLVLLINHDGDSLNYGHYVSDFFYANTIIWWHCDDDNITKIRDLSKGVYIRERVTKNKYKKQSDVGLNRCIICFLY